MNPDTRIAIIGCGSIGSRHLSNILLLGYKNILVFEPNEQRRCELEKKYKTAFASEIDQVWSFEPAITFLTTPTALHTQGIIEILEKSESHIFVEKPIGHSSSELDQIMNAVSKQRRKVMTGCNLRFHPCIQKIKELVHRNIIGTIVSAHIDAGQYLPDWHPLEDYRSSYSALKALGGGCVLDYIHEIDYANWLFGRPKQVASFFGQRSHLEIETEDSADILLKYEAGMVCTIHLDYIQRVYGRSCKIIGDQGTISWNFPERKVRLFVAADKAWHEYPEPDGFQYNDCYLSEIAYFFNCCEQDTPHFSDVSEAFLAVRIVESVKQSNESKRIVEV